MSRQVDSEETAVLIVEDEQELADVFAASLADEYTVEAVYTGEDALDALHPGVDIVLLDRRLPGISGSEVLGEIREREVDCQVAMVSAVEPEEEMLELDIDEYVRKPVSCTDLNEVVAELARRQTLEADLQTYLAQLSKKRTLEAEQSVDSLASSSQYQKLLVDLAERRTALTETLAQEAGPRTGPGHTDSLGKLVSGTLLIGLLAACGS